MLKRNDIILVSIIILLSLAGLFYWNLTKEEGSKLVVTVDGKVYNTYELNKDGIFTISLDNGEWNKFEIKNKTVNMLDANCPDMLCVKDFKNIHYNHQTITCLPHKVVLEIVGGEDNQVDMIAK